MSGIQVIGNLIGLGIVAWIVWYFWLYRREGVQVAESLGVQEVRIRVKGGYDPDLIAVKRGKPVRLYFTREESALCSETVIFDTIGQSASSPRGKRWPSSSHRRPRVRSPFSARWECYGGRSSSSSDCARVA